MYVMHWYSIPLMFIVFHVCVQLTCTITPPLCVYRLLREKPNCSMVAMESLILFKRNKTAKWLKSRSAKEKDKLFKACIKVGRQRRQVHHQREESIRAHRQKVLQDREKTVAARRVKDEKRKEDLCQKISQAGFWSSEAKIQSGLTDKSELEQRKHLETQLRFRQHVLKQTCTDKSMFCVSRKGKKLSSSELATNLLKLVSVAPSPTTGEVLRSPELLIGLEIRHRFDDCGILTWYDGMVIGMQDMDHEVLYFGEKDVCQFDLLEDLASGDLTVL